MDNGKMAKFEPTPRRAPVARAVVIGIAAVAALAALAACRTPRASSDVAPPSSPPAPAAVALAPPTAPALPRVTLHPAGGRPWTFAVEVARTPGERERGLMFRRTLPEDHGMLFVFTEDGRWPFYMRNTYIPLDLIYIDAASRVVGFIEDMRPLDETPRGIDRPARYVLEINAHMVRRIGLRVGDRVSLPPLPPALPD